VFPTPTDFAGWMNTHDDVAHGGVGLTPAVARCQIHGHRADAFPEPAKGGQEPGLHEVARVVGELESSCMQVDSHETAPSRRVDARGCLGDERTTSATVRLSFLGCSRNANSGCAEPAHYCPLRRLHAARRNPVFQSETAASTTRDAPRRRSLGLPSPDRCVWPALRASSQRTSCEHRPVCPRRPQSTEDRRLTDWSARASGPPSASSPSGFPAFVVLQFSHPPCNSRPSRASRRVRRTT
jgi:hypothetical protein